MPVLAEVQHPLAGATGNSTPTSPRAMPDTLRLQVRAIRLLAERIHAFELHSPNGEALPPAAAGAHVDVHLPGGLVRPYSLAGNPRDRTHWTLGVLRDTAGRGGSRAMHEQLRVGDMITVSAPRNAFALAPAAPHSLLLAGGIGITPLKAMAHELAAQGAAFDLHYCARTPRHATFVEELRRVVPPGRLHLHFDQGQPGQGLDIAALLSGPGLAAAGTHVYYCGPAGFMQACASASRHWAPAQVHCEHFTAPAPRPAALPEGSFEVLLSRQGLRLQVPPEQTIVRAIELAGLRVPTSCLSGLCGACKTGYLAGDVDHQDYILSDEEKQHCMTVCVSRCRSPLLVLDL